MANDPGSAPAPQPRRRRTSSDEPGLDPTFVGATDGQDDTPLPTFVHAARLPVLDDRSPDPEVCPFLRAIDDRNQLTGPVEAPDAANRCAALGDPVPQSLRQQELVCLASSHINCPRYLRGAVVIAETPAPVVHTRGSMSTPVLASLLALILAVSASIAFVLARGGLELAVAASASPGSSATSVAAVSPSPVPTSPPNATSSTTPASTVAPTASPTPSPSAAPTPSPTPAPTPQPTAKPTAEPTPASARYALLRACPGTARCWIYRVRAGDNLYSIAHYFGVSLDSIYARNPWTRTQGLRAGRELRLPPPTR